MSASRAEQRVQDALPATTLITREQIERAQTPDLPSLLRSVAGVEFAQNGGMGTVSSAFLRGAESRHTLVLIDGVPVNNLNFGTAAMEHLPLADVERIEIVRGNVSSLYGSAAVGGVIQIFTRQPGPVPQVSLSTQVGSRGLVQASGSGSVKLASGTGLRATVETLRDNGFNSIRQDERPGTNPDRDGYRRRAASLAVTQDIAGGHSLGLTLREARGTTEYDSQFGPATQPDESRFAERGATLVGQFKLGDVRINALMGRSEDRLNADVTAFPFFVNSRSHTAQVGAEWQLRPGHRLTGGVEHTRQRLESDTVYNEAGRTLDSARLGYVLDTAAHQLQLNVRQDRYSDFGTATTWLAAYGYRLTEAWRVSASASTGFNAPTFNDLYYPFGGNPALRPERVKSAELGLQYAVAGHKVRATLFQNRFTDLIASDLLFNRVNVGRARTRGVEVTYDGRLLGTDVHAALTSQDPRDLDTGMRLRRRAATLAQVSADREVGAWQFGGRLRYSGARDDAPFRLGSYSVVDATGGYKVSPELRLFGRVENLFDRAYETVYGYRQAGRGLFVGLAWQPRL
ncbi:TonB-dependent receptor [Ramlibacter sp.]|uniref:TonB-dependent receptor domain-containing protein n=1 Tax=Ramlibacter sp. TaxID=1917967 RepID=UPI002620A11A|nr:TonB-dependent receptor [Ramlibacter sp.]